MKIIKACFLIFSITLIISCGGGGGETVSTPVVETTPYQHYTIPETGGIMMVGDSNTQYCNWSDLMDYPIRNTGIAGQKTFELIPRLPEFLSHKPDKIFILIGVCDIGAGYSPDSVIANYRQILDIIKTETPLAEIHVESVLPVNPDVPDSVVSIWFNPLIIELNSKLESLCAEYGVEFINSYPLMISESALDPDYTYDGLHLSHAGYLEMKTILYPYMF